MKIAKYEIREQKYVKSYQSSHAHFLIAIFEIITAKYVIYTLDTA